MTEGYTKKWLARCVCAVLVTGGVAGCSVSVDPPPPGDAPYAFADDDDPALAALPFVETELLVQPLPGVEEAELQALFAEVGAEVVERLDEIQLVVLLVPQGRLSEVAGALDASGLIDTLQKNYILEAQRVPDDPLYGLQPYLAQVRAPQAWDVTVSAPNVIIAIVDTGVDDDHPDLSAKIIDGRNIRDGNDLYDDVEGHGTSVAGVAAAATNNGVGVAGVAWESPILAVRVANADGLATARDVGRGMLWAVNRGARVVNVSFAPLWSNRVVRSAARHAFRRGSLVVISAGNSGSTTTGVGYPEALFVGAVNASDQIASFSDRGPFVDLVAPGTNIRTTAMGGSTRLINGTSFSAPIVSGVAALVWSVKPELRTSAVQQILLDSAKDIGPFGDDDVYGAGAVDAEAALNGAIGTASLPDTSPPTVRIEQPTGGVSLSGRSVLEATASDDEAVEEVTFAVDGVFIAADWDPPYRLLIDADRFGPGAHELTVTAIDTAGNVSQTQTLTVTFRASSDAEGLGPAIIFETPEPGSLVETDTLIQATVSDPDGLSTVAWLVDGVTVLEGTLTTASTGVSYLWRVGAASPGSHTITLTVTDTTGDETTAHLELVIP